MARNILLIVSSMNSGGAERVAAHLVNAWAERGDTVALLMTFSGRGECFYQISNKIRVIFLADLAERTGIGLLDYWARFRALRHYIRDARPDVVVSFLSHVNIAAILAARGLGCRIIVSERIYPLMVPLGRLWSLLRRVTYPMAYCVAMQTTKGQQWLESHIPRAKGVVIPKIGRAHV
jgi:UDP-N-acetylglucosamine:LPS N-acetylglucosamine transferase